MRTKLLTLLLAFSAIASAQTFRVKGDVGTTQYDGLRLYVTKIDVADWHFNRVIDSTSVLNNGRFTLSMPIHEEPFLISLDLPLKGDEHHPEAYDLPSAQCIAEAVSIKINYSDEGVTLKGGKMNADYERLICQPARDAKKQVNAMAKRRAEAEQARPLTDEENEAFNVQLRQIYKANEPILTQFVEKNISNRVGATLFFGRSPNFYGQDTWNNLFASVPEAYKNQYLARQERERQQQEAITKARQATQAGQQYHDFASKDVNGNATRLSDIVSNSRATLLVFWASWCAPCRAEIPTLKQLYEKYHASGFNIVSVSLDNHREAWLKAVEKEQMAWPQWGTAEGFKAEAATRYAVQAIPFVVLIDANGNMPLVNIHGKQLETKIREALKQ